jgi:hypothetical protein
VPKREFANEKLGFFSQEMASSYSHNNGIPLAILLEWYKVRDTFFGQNFVDQNIPLALEMCASDARWLSEACAGKDVTTKEDPKRVFSALGQKTLVRSVLFGIAVTRTRWKISLRCAA